MLLTACLAARVASQIGHNAAACRQLSQQNRVRACVGVWRAPRCAQLATMAIQSTPRCATTAAGLRPAPRCAQLATKPEHHSLAAPQPQPGCARPLAIGDSAATWRELPHQARVREYVEVFGGCLSVCDWAPYSGLTWVRISCCRNALNTGCEVRGTSPSRRRRAARRSRAAAKQHHACERPNAREMSRGLRDVRSAIHVRLGVHAGMSTGMQDERLYSFQYSECDGCFRDEHDRRKDISRRSRCRATYLHEGIGAAIKWHARPRVIHHTVRIHCEPYPCLL